MLNGAQNLAIQFITANFLRTRNVNKKRNQYENADIEFFLFFACRHQNLLKSFKFKSHF